MPGENVCLADPVIGEKAVGRLGVRLVLAGKRYAVAHRPFDLLHKHSKTPIQHLVAESHPASSSSNQVEPLPSISRRSRVGARDRITRDSGRAIGRFYRPNLWVKGSRSHRLPIYPLMALQEAFQMLPRLTEDI
jgi:hypothetical protein